MSKILVLILSMALPLTAFAEIIVDIHGDLAKHGDVVLAKYAKKITETEGFLQQKVQKSKGKIDDKTFKTAILKRQALIKNIKDEFGFLYVDFNTVFYPGDDNQYTTVEVVNKTDPQRLRFVEKPLNHHVFESKKDLINQMIEFSELDAELMLSGETDGVTRGCPVFHCLSGFDNPKMKPYLKVFNRGVIKDRKLVIDTLNHDKNPERRAAAAFLVGHFNDPEEIVSILTPHITDINAGVRNNVMRVIGTTLRKANITEIDAKPFIDVLDSPYETDRNKALWVLSNLAKSKAGKKAILEQGGAILVDLMRLKQPNNHDFAYIVLKRISGKNFGTTNFSAWESWIASAKSQLV